MRNLLMIMTMFLMLCAVGMGAIEGTGTSGDPWTIPTAADWNTYAGTASYWNAAAQTAETNYAEVTATLDFDGVASNACQSVEASYFGIIDGKGFVWNNPTVTNTADNQTAIFESPSTGAIIKNLVISGGQCSGGRDEVYKTYTAMIGAEVSSTAVIRNCVLINCTVQNQHNEAGWIGFVGMVAGANHGIVEDCLVIGGSAKGDVITSAASSGINVGGVTGYQTYTGTVDGYTRNCYSSATVTHQVSAASIFNVNLGGIVGATQGVATGRGRVTDCSFNGSIVYTGGANAVVRAGGIIGENVGYVERCIAGGSITVSADNEIDGGGIAGRCTSQYNLIDQCKSSTVIDLTDLDTDKAIMVGGILGHSGSGSAGVPQKIIVRRSEFTGQITTDSKDVYIGSGIGYVMTYVTADIDELQSTAFFLDITSTTTDYIGGCVGFLGTDPVSNLGSSTVDNCIIRGTIQFNGGNSMAAATRFGGFGGHIKEGSLVNSCIAVLSPWTGQSANVKDGFTAYVGVAPTTTSCYFDSDYAGHTTSGTGTASTTAELQAASLAGINSPEWVLAAGEYPKLTLGKYDTTGGGTRTTTGGTRYDTK
jgi:hypothetical protein